MSRRASSGPNESTGALNQAGSWARQVLRKATRRGQRGQSRPGSPLCGGMAAFRKPLIVLELVLNLDALRGRAALQELRGVARFAALARLPRFAHRPLRRIAPDLALHLDDVDKLVGLPAQLV